MDYEICELYPKLHYLKISKEPGKFSPTHQTWTNTELCNLFLIAVIDMQLTDMNSVI